MSGWLDGFTPGGAKLAHNGLVKPAGSALTAAAAAVLPADAMDLARREISAWDGYAPTPLRPLPDIADALGLGAIALKDESGRFGLGSFKALGGAYAVYRVMARLVEERTGKAGVTGADLRTGRYADILRDVTVVTATDGNHGKSVAWGAGQVGCACKIYLHAEVSPGREAAIAAYGPEMIRVKGDYDDSVRQAAADAEANGWIVISDTSYPGYAEIPALVMHGYTVMAAEMAEQFHGQAPTHAFVPAGVGGVAAALAAGMRQAWGEKAPCLVVVEPEKADCLYRSALAGRPAKAEGDLETVMACLSAGEVSLSAWDVLADTASFFVTLPDPVIAPTMRRLAEAGIVSGESGAAALAGVASVALDPELRERMGLDASSRVLAISTEGATDPEIYERLVGRAPGKVTSPSR